jgi:hypothetical protein
MTGRWSKVRNVSHSKKGANLEDHHNSFSSQKEGLGSHQD